MATLKILLTSTLNLFFHVFLKCSSVSCITGYTNSYAKKNYYTQSSFEFKKGYSIDHAIIHFVNQVQKSFESDSYTFAVFRDLSKACDTVDRSIFLKKLEIYGVNTTNLAWFIGQLNGRKQYIKITESTETVKKDIKCGVPQGSILILLLFLLYVNDLRNSLNVFVSIMFADDTNLVLNII